MPSTVLSASQPQVVVVVVGSSVHLHPWNPGAGSLPLFQALEGPPASFPTCLTWEWEEGRVGGVGGKQLGAQREGARTGGGGGGEERDRKEVSPSPGVGGLDFGGIKKDHM